METLLLAVMTGGMWLVYRNFRQERARVKATMRLEWPGVLALTKEGRDVYATAVLRALCDDVEPDLAWVTERVEAADLASFEQSASPETHRHHATYMTAFYQRAAIASVMGADPYRADDESMIENALEQLAEAGAVPARRRLLTRRALAQLVETSLEARAKHGDGQLRRRLEALEATLADLERLARPRSWEGPG